MKMEVLMKTKMFLALAASVSAAQMFAGADISAGKWISPVDQKVYTGAVKDGSRAMPGTAWFAGEIVNERAVVSAKWTTSALGVYEIYVNGRRVGEEFLKPGYTHVRKTRYSFSHDVTALMKTGGGERNAFAAEVGAGWWRDKIVTPVNGGGGFHGKKSAFRGVLEVKYADGSVKKYGTDAENWKAGVAGPVVHSAIFDGEEYDARIASPYYGENLGRAELNHEFAGEVHPSDGAEVYLRRDLTLGPAQAYSWKGVTGADGDSFGRINVVRRFGADEILELGEGETLVVDFGQNVSAVPSFRFRAAPGTVLTALPAEMLNDRNGLKKRGNDGPEGSVYRVNLRAGYENGRLVRYVFAGKGTETYMPRFSFFGYRYMSLTATASVSIEKIESVPVSSIRLQDELGSVETGDATLNRFIKNVYWGQLSNYLSVPTDCPQRNERLGWAADTQVFAESASFNADVYDFLRKWMRDMRDSQHEDGSFPSVAPYAQYGNEGRRVGWADAGVIVPYVMWKQFADTRIVEENYGAMARFLKMQALTQYRTETAETGEPFWQYADWLSFEDYEPCNGSAYEKCGGRRLVRSTAVRYWNFLAGCYWHQNALLMAEMAKALGKDDDIVKYRFMAEMAMRYIRGDFVDPESGMLIKPFRHLQGAALFALKFKVLEKADAVEATKKELLENIAAHGGTLSTGFLGTSVILDVLSENGMTETAYSLLLSRKFPGWLYSVEQGATTVWERWNSYTKKDGFGPVDMNSFNHYAYGCVLGWIYRNAAGIAADAENPGFKTIVMAPKPDRRLGFVRASYRSAAGPVKSEWRYEGEKWIWEFSVPDGAVAKVTLPGEKTTKIYRPGSYRIER